VIYEDRPFFRTPLRSVTVMLNGEANIYRVRRLATSQMVSADEWASFESDTGSIISFPRQNVVKIEERL
jgi:hypothetical protein